MPQDSILFGSVQARAIPKRDRLLAGFRAICPHCFQWEQADRRLCALCDGEEVVDAWEVIEYLEPAWHTKKREAYLVRLATGSGGDPRWEALAEAIRETAVSVRRREVHHDSNSIHPH